MIVTWGARPADAERLRIPSRSRHPCAEDWRPARKGPLSFTDVSDTDGWGLVGVRLCANRYFPRRRSSSARTAGAMSLRSSA